jgi:hypothetical protein
MGVVETIAVTMGIAWASGINLYATIAMLGLLGTTGNIDLPPDLLILQDPLVIAAAGFMYIVEFFADKVPGVDSGWDVLHTFIRIPAGAVLAAGAVGELGAGAELAAAIAGGTLAASTHSVKAGSRLMINASPEPFTNWAASITEDIAVIGALWLALNHPVIWVVLLVIFVLLLIWLLPKLWRGIRALFRKIGSLFGGKAEEPPPAAAETDPAGDAAFAAEASKTIRALDKEPG